MENIEYIKNEKCSFYVSKSSDFAKLKEVINLMPSFEVKEVVEKDFLDTFYETREKFLNNIGASIRIRKDDQTQTLSIACSYTEGIEKVRREFETSMYYGSTIESNLEYIMFLEDKIRDIYTHRIDADVIRLLSKLIPMFAINTKRTIYRVIHNNGFSCDVNFDDVEYNTKTKSLPDKVFEVKSTCVLDKDKKETYDRFVNELKRRVTLIPMGEYKYDAGKRLLRLEMK